MSSRPALDELVTILTGEHPPRVWSLLVTVFGDLAQEEGSAISGAVLRAVASVIGFKPEAVRVALHRLRKEGWIESSRKGRQSDYYLTDWGRAQSAAASPLIYSRDEPGAEAWLILGEPGNNAEKGISIGSGQWIAPHASSSDDELSVRLNPDVPVPRWIRQRLCTADILALGTETADRFIRLSGHIDRLCDLPALDRVVLRVLIVHAWRRVVLRAPRLPDHIMPEGWRGPECRSIADALLTALPRPTLHELEQSVAKAA